MHPQQRFLHHVLGLGDAAKHSVGDRERDRPQLVEQSLAIGHAAANPCRRLGCFPIAPVAPDTNTLNTGSFDREITPRHDVLRTCVQSGVAERGVHKNS
jgi:hypothetical protein